MTLYLALSFFITLFLLAESNPIPTSFVTETQTEEVVEYVTDVVDEIVATKRFDIHPRPPAWRRDRPWRIRGIATTQNPTEEADAEPTQLVTHISNDEMSETTVPVETREENMATLTPAPVQVLTHKETFSPQRDSVTTETIEKQNATAERVHYVTTDMMQTEIIEATELVEVTDMLEVTENTTEDTTDISKDFTAGTTQETPATDKPHSDTGGVVIDVDIIIDGQDPRPGYIVGGNGDSNGNGGGNGQDNGNNNGHINGQYFMFSNGDGLNGQVQVYVHVEPRQHHN